MEKKEQTLKQQMENQLYKIELDLKLSLEKDTEAYQRAMESILAFHSVLNALLLATETVPGLCFAKMSELKNMVIYIIAQNMQKYQYRIKYRTTKDNLYDCFIWAGSFFGASEKFKKFRTECPAVEIVKIQ